MTQAEKTQAIIEAERKFYAWEPPGNEFQNFRCHHLPSTPRMTEKQCMARASKPEIYREAGCSNSCPRWKHYRKLTKKAQKEAEDNIVRRAYR